MEKTLFVSDVATGCLKLASGLRGTVSSLKVAITVLVSEPNVLRKHTCLFKMP